MHERAVRRHCSSSAGSASAASVPSAGGVRATLGAARRCGALSAVRQTCRARGSRRRGTALRRCRRPGRAGTWPSSREHRPIATTPPGTTARSQTGPPISRVRAPRELCVAVAVVSDATRRPLASPGHRRAGPSRGAPGRSARRDAVLVLTAAISARHDLPVELLAAGNRATAGALPCVVLRRRPCASRPGRPRPDAAQPPGW